MAVKLKDLPAHARRALRSDTKSKSSPSKLNVTRDGLGEFGSKAEERRFAALRQAEGAGLIQQLHSHPYFRVEPDGCEKIGYHPDTVYIDIDGTMSGKPGLVCEEFKPRGWRKIRGMADAAIRMKLFRWKYGSYRMIVVSEERGRFVITEERERR